MTDTFIEVDLSPADLEIIGYVHKYRFLSTWLLALLARRTPAVIRRAARLRLRPGGYLVNFTRSASEQGAVTLGPKGLELVARQLGCAVHELSFPMRAGGERSFFFRHHLMVAETRIALDMAGAHGDSPIVIHRSVAEWHARPGARAKAPHHERFLLSERFVGTDGNTQWIRPDCFFLMSAKATPTQLVAVYVECDRATESMAKIAQKIKGFFHFHQRRLFRDIWGAIAMRVLFVVQTRDARRIESMRETLRAFCAQQESVSSSAIASFRRCFRFALASELSPTTALVSQIWQDAEGTQRFFFQPVEHTDAAVERPREMAS